MKTILSLAVAFILVIVFQSCKEDSSFELTAYSEKDYKMMSEYLDIATFPPDYNFEIPGSFIATQINDSQAELGRVLFYDKNLSKDRTISCESCHQQHLAFADDVAFSTGVEDRKTSRNSQGLGSVLSFAAYYGSASLNQIPFFWDNRASSVQEQSEQTLNNPQEMDMKMFEVVNRINEQPYYAPLFKSAYVDGKVTEQRVLDAISEFINSMATFDSPFDKALLDGANLNTDFVSFSKAENIGKQLFLSHCATCHNRQLGRPNKTAANNGLDVVYEDKGIGALTNQPSDMGMFKVPTLRNLELTAPYMHDGRFETLEEVVEHYSTGIKAHQNLSGEFRMDFGGTGTVEPRQLNFTAEEKAALVDFLETFTDMDFVKNPKYANPFK